MFGTRVWALFITTAELLFAATCVGQGSAESLNHYLPHKRTYFQQLLAANPNHFGNAPETRQKPIFPLANDTTYENLTCVGFNPVVNLLSATISVKLPTGFNGSLCTPGSWEYIRFWVSYGGAWSNLGYAAVNTHDIANGLDCKNISQKPLQYTVTIPFVPKHQNCSNPVLPNIRAVLSWSEVPSDTDPDWSPVWGNRVDQHVQSQPTSSTSSALRKSVGNFSEVFNSPSFGSYQMYPFDSTAIAGLSFPRGRSALSSPAHDQSPLPGGLRPMAGDTSYEELTCLGLDYGLSSLVATVKIKRPSGYDTGPCYNGSWEYVAFWADWNNTCNYTYLGTVPINVHDFANIPSDGLAYTAVLPVDMNSARSFCDKTKIARVRAALSWETQPSVPPALPAYGNWLEVHVQLQSYAIIPPITTPSIQIIGDVPIHYIEVASSGMTVVDARYTEGQPTDRSAHRQCPFGGLIKIRTLLTDNLLGYSYRLMARRVPPTDPATSPGVPITNEIDVLDLTKFPPDLPTTGYLPDSEGYFDYLPRINNFYGDLAFWAPDDGLWQIRLEMATKSLPHVNKANTPWYNIFVNNERPTGDVLFTTGGVCGELTVGQTLEGVFFASATYFDQFTISITPDLIPHPINPASGQSPVPSVGGSPVAPWTLDTTDGTACGFVVQLRVWALTVYNSNPWDPLTWGVDRGFCLSEP